MTASQAAGRWPDHVPDAVWAPLAAGALMLLAGATGLATGQLLLFPSLGPTAFLQVETPDQPAARFYNTVAGHAGGLVAGLLAVWLLQVGDAPSVFAAGHLLAVRVWASVLAIALTLTLLAVARASHPPAAATTLLFSLGGLHATIHDVLAVAAGVLIVAIAGEGLRRARLGQFVHDAGQHRTRSTPRPGARRWQSSRVARS